MEEELKQVRVSESRSSSLSRLFIGLSPRSKEVPDFQTLDALDASIDFDPETGEVAGVTLVWDELDRKGV